MIFFKYKTTQKKTYLTFILFLTLSTISHQSCPEDTITKQSCTQEPFFDNTFSSLDTRTLSDSDIDDDDDAYFQSISMLDLTTTRSCSPGEASEWVSVFTALNVPKILNITVFKKTSLPNSRNIINFPNFLLCSYPCPTSDQLTFHAFYNQTSKQYFTRDEADDAGTRIGSYLDVKDKTVLDVLAENLSSLPADLASLKNLNLPDFFGTVANARLQERRIGFLGHYYHQVNSATYFEAKLPCLWMIKNINFTDAEKKSIKKQLADFQGGNFDEDAFAKDHIIMDALGLGTLELSICKELINGKSWHLDGGVCLYLPTDVHFARGLYGTYFDPKDQQPQLSFCDLVENFSVIPPYGVVNPNATSILSNYFYGALNHLSSQLLQCNLGNDQHVGIGLKLNPYWEISESWQCNSSFILELFAPKEQNRFFINKLSKPFTTTFSALTNDDDKLNAIESRLTQVLYPRVFATYVLPGLIFNYASNVQKNYRNWNFTLGYSGWYKAKEKFLCICRPTAQDYSLDIDKQKSLTPSAWSAKLHEKIHHTFYGTRYDASISLWSDQTIFGNGIGNDFSLGISIDTNF